MFPGEDATTKAWSSNRRPFLICPINYKNLLEVSNKSIYNICVFKEKQIVGFAVLSHKENYFVLDILCTKPRQKIGTYLMNLIIKLADKTKIRIIPFYGTETFYQKFGFIKQGVYMVN